MSAQKPSVTSWKDWLTKKQFPAWIYIIFLVVWALAVYCYVYTRTG